MSRYSFWHLIKCQNILYNTISSNDKSFSVTNVRILSRATVYVIHEGNNNAHPTVTSKMLLPTELETAISPNPFRATITLVIRSGMLVPAARNVSPITSGGMRIVSPATFAHQTIRYEYAAIQQIEPMNVTAKNFFPVTKRSGIGSLVSARKKIPLQSNPSFSRKFRGSRFFFLFFLSPSLSFLLLFFFQACLLEH